MSGDSVDELDSSELGTKEYWDNTYTTELNNYESHGDIGEIWFDEDSQFRVIRWMNKNIIQPSASRIVDVGCGNGMMLIELAREGYRQLTGFDYSSNAIRLAKTIAQDQNIDITYKVMDLLNLNSMALDECGQFDVVHDKGTYDAISLHPDDTKSKRKVYIENIYRLTKDVGIFIITSCNWTETELINAFQPHFVRVDTIPAPTFKFGGKIGSVVTTVVLKKKTLIITEKNHLEDINEHISKHKFKIV